MPKLSQCKEKDQIRVQKIQGAGPFRKRLLEMGVTRGTKLTILKYAPLKDPMEIAIKDYRLSLRVEEASHIDVEKF